jgi:hypothetical protein
VGVAFDGYVTITTSTKEELGYASLSKEDKSVVDTTLKARESCVSSVFPKPKVASSPKQAPK